MATPALANQPPRDPCAAEHDSFVASQSAFPERVQPAPRPAGQTAGQAAVPAQAGYFAAMAARYPDTDALARAIHADLQREAQNRERLGAAMTSLRACRLGIARAIRQQVMAHTLPRPIARHRLLALRDITQQELGMADRAWAAMGKRDQQFQDAAKALVDRPARFVPPPGNGPRQVPAITPVPAATLQVQIAATETIPEKRRSLQGLISTTRSDMQSAFDLDANPS